MTAASRRRSERSRALNQRTAEMLGWTELRIEETSRCNARGDYYTHDALIGTTPQGVKDQCVPDFSADLNAIAAVLSRHDITLRLDFGPAYAARIIPEGRVNEPPMPEFSAYSVDYYYAHGERADISELAALAFADWLTWAREQGGAP